MVKPRPYWAYVGCGVCSVLLAGLLAFINDAVYITYCFCVIALSIYLFWRDQKGRS